MIPRGLLVCQRFFFLNSFIVSFEITRFYGYKFYRTLNYSGVSKAAAIIWP